MHYIKEIRESTSLTQKAFANKFGIPLSTLRKWEQGESNPPEYVVSLIENSLPCYKKNYREVKGNNNCKYYIDSAKKMIGDSLGNWIPFNANIDNVSENNLLAYIETLFNDFYEIQKRFNSMVKHDYGEMVLWK